jgi:predicted deacylase
LVEHCVELGEEVRAGQFIAKIDYIERTGSPSQEYYASIDGSSSGGYFLD